MGNDYGNNPFAGSDEKAVVQHSQGAMTESGQAREIAEVQAAMAIAKKFPRDGLEATERVLTACRRPTLAEAAIYAYPRGGQMVTGPSIRLAEAIGQYWGNIQFGIRELSQGDGESTVEAFAWDIETNTRAVKVFQVPHLRTAKGKTYRLTDPRDIYELVANQGARRMRACILSIVPGDVVEAAVKECETTQKHSVDASKDTVRKMLEAFADYGVSRVQIEKRLGHKLDSIIVAEMLNLKRIYTSIKDGMSAPADYFPPEEKPGESGSSAKAKVTAKVEALKNGHQEAEPEEESPDEAETEAHDEAEIEQEEIFG
jgi:hypothetical protein